MAEVRKQEHEDVADLPEGFKVTELGPLPEEWKVVRLGDKLIEQKQKNRSGRTMPVYTVSNVHGFILSNEFFDKQVYSRDLTNYKIVEKGDFAYNPYRVNVGSLALFTNNNPGLVSPAYTIFRVSSKGLDPNFLLMLFKTSNIRREIERVAMSRGSVRRSLAFKDLADFVISLPPLPEQRKIAHVLSIIQRAIELQDKVIASLRELKKSLMHHLFTYGPVPVDQIDRVPLKETEIGTVPEHWEVVRLGEAITQAQYGLSMRGESTDKYPIIRMNNLSDGRVDINSLQYVNLEKNTYSRFRLNKGDILFNRTNSYELVGKTSIFNLNGEYVFASYIIRLVTDDNRLISTFLNHYLNMESTQGRLKLLATRGVSQSNISASKLKGFLIPIPPIFEQKQIANFLTLMDQKINVEDTRKSTLQSLFQTLLHLLMTGQVRANYLAMPETKEAVS